MLRFLVFLFLMSLTSCKGQVNELPKKKAVKEVIAEVKIIEKSIKNLQELKLEKDKNKTYTFVKASVEKTRKSSVLKTPLDTLSKRFKEALLHRIIPFWEGTEWTFEGHTSKPKIGEIACGYFVSTTLKHIGVNINRYHLAQQGPINEAKSLALGGNIIEISEDSNEKNIKAIGERLQEGIYFIGFDINHVGYILKEKGKLYVIHSNYIDSKGVEIEPVEKSEAFLSYFTFYIVPLSTNKKLLENWVTGKEVIVIKK